jgi:hypothetical protein
MKGEKMGAYRLGKARRKEATRRTRMWVVG